MINGPKKSMMNNDIVSFKQSIVNGKPKSIIYNFRND